jgi:hypothetical protein
VIRLAAAAAALVAAAPATAQGPPPPNDSAASQYVEAIPSAEGATPAGLRTSKQSQRLQSVVKQRLRVAGGSDAAALERLATSPSLGAPGPVTTARPAIPLPKGESTRSAIRSSLATSVTSSGGDGRIALLGAGLLAITAATIVAAIRRARSEGRRPAR